MKNDDLVWVRENAGLSQKQASELLGVSRRTFIRWETGDTPIPNVKWNAFLIAVNTPESAIPKKKEENPDPVVELMGEEWPGSSLTLEEWADEMDTDFILAIVRAFGKDNRIEEEKLRTLFVDMTARHDVKLAVKSLVHEGCLRRSEDGKRLYITEKGREEYLNHGEDLIG